MADSHKAIPRLILLLTMNTTVEDTDYQPTPNQDEVKALQFYANRGLSQVTIVIKRGKIHKINVSRNESVTRKVCITDDLN